MSSASLFSCKSEIVWNTCNCPCSIIPCFSVREMIMLLSTCFWFNCYLLFPHQRLSFSILGKHGFVVWKLFTLLDFSHLSLWNNGWTVLPRMRKYLLSLFFFSLQRVTFNKFSCYQTSPWSYLFVIPLFCARLNFGKCLSIQCNIKSTGSKCRHWNCWQKLLISFAPVGTRVIPLPSSPPISQSGETAFYRSLMKYSPFVWPAVLENLLYLAFCFIPTEEYMHMFSNYFFFPVCLLAYLIFWLSSLFWVYMVLAF